MGYTMKQVPFPRCFFNSVRFLTFSQTHKVFWQLISLCLEVIKLQRASYKGNLELIFLQAIFQTIVQYTEIMETGLTLKIAL